MIKVTENLIRSLYTSSKDTAKTKKMGIKSIEDLLDLIKKEPYRLFFPAGILVGMGGVAHWLFYAAGWIPAYSGFFHASMIMQLYLACFVIGFLTTAIPRLTGTRTCSTSDLAVFCVFLGFQALSASWAERLWGEMAQLGWMILLLRFPLKRIGERRQMADHSAKPMITPPVEFIWVPIGLLTGILGLVLLGLGQKHLIPAFFLLLGDKLQKQGFILAVVLGVGGFLGPRLTGRFRTLKKSDAACSAEPETKMPVSTAKLLGLHLALAVLFVLSFILEAQAKTAVAYSLRALIASFVFLRTGVLPLPPRVPDLYVRLLWLSFWMVLAGLWGAAIFPAYLKECLHILFIGGFSLMIFSVASMVVLSHAGCAGKLRGTLWGLNFATAGIVLALILRMTAVFFPAFYFQILGAASVCWMAGGLLWLIFMGGYFFLETSPESFEQMHEEAKRRLAVH